MRSHKAQKSEWESRAGELFDLYIEVGDIKLSSLRSDNCRLVECWISSCFHRSSIREECRDSERLPIYGVIKHIELLCEGEDTCVMIMEDDTEDAVKNWRAAIYLLVKYLKRIENIKAVVLFTNKTREEMSEAQKNEFLFNYDQSGHLALCETVDVCVTRRSNIFSDPDKSKIYINDRSCSKYVKDWLVNDLTNL